MRLLREHSVPNGVDTAVQTMKAPAAHPLLERPLPHPKPLQLPPRHHPILRLRKLGDPNVQRVRLLYGTHWMPKSRRS